MKTLLNRRFALLIVLAAISCKKENNNVHASSVSETTEESAGLKIGQFYQGGVIFYLDSTKLHGLVADTADFPRTVWWNGVFTVTGATKRVIGTGKSNTKKIILSQGDSGVYAARECWTSTRNGYKDWFLPSLDELDSMYVHRKQIGNLRKVNYWSSTERDLNYAWHVNFATGSDQSYNTKWLVQNVRAIRQF